jgi:hypothetical protein
MQDTLVQYSPTLMRENMLKSQMFLSGKNCSKWAPGKWKVMKEVVFQGLTELIKVL